MPTAIHRYGFLAAAAGWMIVIYYLSAQPGLSLPPIFSLQDKLVHAGIYGLLALLLVFALTPRGTRPGWTVVLLVTLFAIGYGITDEWHQMHVPGRTASLSDLAADATGAFLACLMARVRRPG